MENDKLNNYDFIQFNLEEVILSANLCLFVFFNIIVRKEDFELICKNNNKYSKSMF